MKHAPFWFVVVLLVFAAFFVAMKKAGAQPDEAQVKRDCRSDALRYCYGSVARYLANPSNPDRRMTILYCMLANKERLQEKCRRHLY